jgi:hypothetical protein
VPVTMQFSNPSIDEATSTIGEQPARNFQFGGVEDHVLELRLNPKAGPLVRILESKAVRDIDRLYGNHDRAADVHQRRSKRAANWILGLLILAVVASAGSLIWPLESQKHEMLMRIGAMLLIYGALLGSLIVAWRTGKSDPHALWSESRGHAEYLRRRLFETVVDIPEPPRTGELPPLLLKLEYFRRYQLDVQRNYHTVRGEQHRRRAWVARTLILPCLVAAIGWIVLLTLVLLGAWADHTPLPSFVPDVVEQGLAQLLEIEQHRIDQIGLITGIGIAILYGALHLRSMLDSNLRNSARYERALENLDYLAGNDLARVRQAAADGNDVAVCRFVDRVHSVMATEHAEWVRLRDLDAGREREGSNAPAHSTS